VVVTDGEKSVMPDEKNIQRQNQPNAALETERLPQAFSLQVSSEVFQQYNIY